VLSDEPTSIDGLRLVTAERLVFEGPDNVGEGLN
jgi:hypothetical protein